MSELLYEDFNDRIGIIVDIKNKKFVSRLKKYGDIHYISKHMNYAVIYVNKEDADAKVAQIEKEKFVRKATISPKGSLALEYDGLLEEMQREIDAKKSAEEKETSSKLFL
ncbi:YlbG family protein [Allofustis seminis]|uniref:YlbG family protein n=1 Tax=Allofustis seminis TaxID=166939 RepID=UPI00037764A5|nr:YlbG family protein [Allofustis seminis]